MVFHLVISLHAHDPRGKCQTNAEWKNVADTINLIMNCFRRLNTEMRNQSRASINFDMIMFKEIQGNYEMSESSKEERKTANLDKEREIQHAVYKKDFFFQDFKHDVSMAGSWTEEDYVINMQFKSLRLNIKLMFNEKNGTGDFNSPIDFNGTPNKYGKTNNVQTCLRNATRPLTNKTCKPRPVGFVKSAWITCQRTTVTVAGWVRNGATRTGNTILNATLTMIGNVYNGMIFVADWTWDKMTWLAEETWDGVMWMADCTWDVLMWLAESIWYHVSWLAGGVWNIVAWFGNVIVTLYAEYLKNHVTHTKAFLAALTWEDMYSVMLIILAVNFCVMLTYLFTTCGMNMIRRRRQARFEKEAAERLAAANANKPVWRPKPKKKRKKNQKDW